MKQFDCQDTIDNDTAEIQRNLGIIWMKKRNTTRHWSVMKKHYGSSLPLATAQQLTRITNN